MNLFDPALGQMHEFISGKSEEDIADILKDVFEENLNKDFMYKSKWSTLEIISTKMHLKSD